MVRAMSHLIKKTTTIIKTTTIGGAVRVYAR